MKLLLYYFTFLGFAIQGLGAQTYNIATQNGQTVTTCSGTFTDSGTGANYGNNEDYSMTFCSSNGRPLLFDFSTPGTFDIDVPGDSLFFYDGASATGTPIAVLTYLDDNTQTTYSSQLQIGTQSTCVTVRFKSNASGTDAGWSAVISCVVPPSCSGNPPASDIFGQATFICNLNGYCGNTSSYYGEDTPFNLIGGGTCPVPDDGIFGGTIENNAWLAFQASATTASFNFNITNCGGGSGLQLAIFGFNGTAFTLMSPCATTDGSQISNTTLSATGLTIGQRYYIMIDGSAGSSCEYTVTANTGVLIVDAGANQNVCGSSATMAASSPGTGVGAWTVVSGSGTFASPSSPISTVSGLAAGANVFAWSVTGTCNNATDNVTITSSNALSITAGSNTPVCAGTSLQLNGPSGFNTYVWSGPGGYSGSGKNPDRDNAQLAMSGVYTVTATSSGGCSGTTTTSVVVNTCAEICGNGIDDDRDGSVDSADGDCGCGN